MSASSSPIIESTNYRFDTVVFPALSALMRIKFSSYCQTGGFLSNSYNDRSFSRGYSMSRTKEEL